MIPSKGWQEFRNQRIRVVKGLYDPKYRLVLWSFQDDCGKLEEVYMFCA